MRRLFLGLIIFTAATACHADGLLSSWNDGAARRTILTFMRNVTQENTPSYIPPNERIVIFDNDGTLWAEKPMYVEFMFAMDRAKQMAPQHPEWQTEEPFKYLLSGDMEAFMADREKAVTAVVAQMHAGMTTEEYQEVVKNWLRTARHPITGRPYTAMVYQPMLELMAYMRSNGFRTFIVGIGGIEFLRAFAEETYGVPPEQVIASSNRLKYEERKGEPVLIKTSEMHLLSTKENKVLAIELRVGRRPIAVFGNSDGELQMIQWIANKSVKSWQQGDQTPRLAVLIHHDDAQREWAYDKSSKVGTLDKALTEAYAKGWTVVSMRDDWKTIYPQVEYKH
jgi:phosphoglycolate phosphatase-like HAD superfamily hydrolase